MSQAAVEEEGGVQDEAVKAAQDSVRLTTSQDRAGVVSYLNVITVQTIALTDEVTAIQIRGRRNGGRGSARPGARRRLDGGRASVSRGRDEAGGSDPGDTGGRPPLRMS